MVRHLSRVVLLLLLSSRAFAGDFNIYFANAKSETNGHGQSPFRTSSFELTGLKDESTVGRPVKDVLGLTFTDGEDPIDTSLEWGVRVLGRAVRVEAEGDLPAEATADVFPAYDEDGGLLLVLTPKR